MESIKQEHSKEAGQVGLTLPLSAFGDFASADCSETALTKPTARDRSYSVDFAS